MIPDSFPFKKSKIELDRPLFFTLIAVAIGFGVKVRVKRPKNTS